MTLNAGSTMRITRKLSVAIALCFPLCSLGQAQGSSNKKEDSPYSKALFASIAEMDKQWSRYSRGDDETAPTDYHHMFVEADPAITDGLPAEFDGYRVEYLDSKGQISHYEKLRKEFAILKIFPIKTEGAKLKIGINVYYFSYKKRRLMYGLSEWSMVKFQFDCDKQLFLISSVELGGI